MPDRHFFALLSQKIALQYEYTDGIHIEIYRNNSEKAVCFKYVIGAADIPTLNDRTQQFAA